MIETIEDIRIKLQNDTYKNEEHVRFSLVARILQKLEWDLWNRKTILPICLKKTKHSTS